jgi:hypothetical protein
MKIELIYDLPLADRLAHRQALLRGLVSQVGAQNVRLRYIGNSPRAYFGAWSRRTGRNSPVSLPKTIKIARDLGIRCALTGEIYQEACDLGIVFTSQKLNTDRLHLPRFGTIAAHYARLPELPGRDALLWARLLGVPAEVSLFQLSPLGIDRGPVLSRHLLSQGAGRDEAQTMSVTALLALVAHLQQHDQLPTPLHPGSRAPLLPRLGRRLTAKAMAL